MSKEEARILIALVEGRAPKAYAPATILDLQCMGWLSRFGRVTDAGRQALAEWAGLYPPPAR